MVKNTEADKWREGEKPSNSLVPAAWTRLWTWISRGQTLPEVPRPQSPSADLRRVVPQSSLPPARTPESGGGGRSPNARPADASEDRFSMLGLRRCQSHF